MHPICYVRCIPAAVSAKSSSDHLHAIGEEPHLLYHLTVKHALESPLTSMWCYTHSSFTNVIAV
jgi:hypothetical protein